MNELDLILIENNGARTMMAATPDWCSSEVVTRHWLYTDAMEPLAKQVVERYPDAFAGWVDCYKALLAINLRNSLAGQNSVGQAYPVVVATA